MTSPRKKARIHWGEEGSSGKQKGVSALQKQREQLPIAKGKEALIREISDNNVIILLGETGSGKTTQVPQYILESGMADTGIIAVTQPRRVAATSLAARVAAEQGVAVGGLVGYSVRFDEACSANTRIKYVSDGMLVRELLSDPLLSRYSVIVVDEAHERTLRTDFLIANLKTIQEKRNGANDVKGKRAASNLNPLKIVIMSATLDAEKFSRFYNHARVLYVKGRQHSVQIYHTAVSQTDYVDAALRTFFQIHTDKPPGDVLIFLPGQEDIESLDKSIKLYARRLPEERMSVVVCPMYASLPPTQQARIFSPTPPNTRKCILSTNIAETSITIPGIRYVIDTGKCKEKRYLSKDTGGGFDTLLTRDITKSSAMQRAGRAGREGPGFCFRLYTEDAFTSMALSAEPEIRRCSLTQSLLQLKCLGQDLEAVEFMDRPNVEAIYSALKTLWLLSALDNAKNLTPLGRQMASFPVEPYLARIILASREHGCASEVIDIVSLISSSSNPFVDISDQRDAIADARRKFRHPSGDHMTMLNALRSYQDVATTENKSGRKEWCRQHFVNERTFVEALKIRDQLRLTCGRLGMDWRTTRADNDEAILRCFVAGLVQQSAFLQPDGSYKQTIGQAAVKIHPGSILCEKKVPAIIYDELVYTSQIYARGVSSVPKSFFTAVTPSSKQS
ncbi:P-loop containing nucleoside triphosphate hydrolase protein [Hygrophoropsis aurantiaca]|uniref:P-loop containing nucleoside triphosphate hydrolase protein n=1 Tax=Hygrophoropsis aurantiaca TaxID=72124 RepID=A0ACB8AI49_9AGAM|nr:P-loop containing nucleoside triphosphate hydrolase protein [Hygrophoropsis aurantiaca]